MLASRILLSVWLLLLLLLPQAARASAAPPDSVLETIRIILTSGDTLQARCVEPAPFDMVAVVGFDGTIRYVPAVRIQMVQEGSIDRTDSVVERGKTIGIPIPQAEKPPQVPSDPRAASKTYAITETSYRTRVRPGRLARSDLHYDLGFDLGMMQNISTSTGLGWGWFFASSDGYVNGGMRVRWRRWLSRSTSVEIAPGIIAAETRLSGGVALPPGYSVQANLGLSRTFILSAEIYTTRRREYGRPDTYGPQNVRETGVLVGAKIARWPGAAMGLLAGFVALFEGTVYASPGIP